MRNKKYIFLEHTADIKFRAYGRSLNGVFENCALAVSEILSRGKKINNIKSKKIKLKGKDNESLLYSFLDELIYLLDAKNFVVAKANVKIRATTFRKSSRSPKGENIILKAEVFGDDTKNYENLDHIKAATYAEMYVKKLQPPAGSRSPAIKKRWKWEAQVVVDV